MNAMDAIPYEEDSFYIFDRGYNDFERLFRINAIGAYFVVRGKKDNDFKPMKWTRRFPKGTDFSELTDEMLAEIEWKLNHRPRKSLGYRTPLEYCKQLFNFNF